MHIEHNVRSVVRRLNNTIADIPGNIREALTTACRWVITSARARLAAITGAHWLMDEMDYSLRREDPNVIAEVGLVDSGDTAQKYAGGLEYGYTVPAMVITARYKRALSFIWPKGETSDIRGLPTRSGPYAGRFAFHHVNRPAYTVAARPFLRPSVMENIPRIKALLKERSIRLVEIGEKQT